MHDLAKDAAHLALSVTPFAFLSEHAALVAALLNVVIVGALRFYEARRRSHERLELAKLRMQLEAKKIHAQE